MFVRTIEAAIDEPGVGMTVSCGTLWDDSTQTLETYVGTWLIAHANQHDSISVQREEDRDTVAFLVNVQREGLPTCVGMLSLFGPGVEKFV